MEKKICLAGLLLAGACWSGATLAADDFGGLGTGSTSSQSGTAPGSASSPSLPTQGGPTGNETSGEAGAYGPSAEQRLPSPPSGFAALDKDKDGMISRREAQLLPGLNSCFPSFDTDRDERLSLAEWNAASALSTDAAGAAGVKGASREGGCNLETLTKGLGAGGR